MSVRAIGAFALAASAAAQSLHHVADEFQHVGPSSVDAVLRFSAALPMSNFEQLEAQLYDISNPQSKNYGNWMTQAEVNALTAPSAAVRAEVNSWVTSTGAKCVDYPTSLRCSATVAQVNSLLNTQVSAFRQTTMGGRIVHRVHPDVPYTFPAHLEGKLLFLTNLADFPTVERRMGKVQSIEIVDGKAAATDYAVLLETLQDFYSLKGIKGSVSATTSPAEFQADSCFNKKDRAEMAKANGIPTWNTTHITGPCTGQDPDAEASLDEQYMGAVGFGNDQWYWTDDDWMFDWTQTLMKTPDAGLPQVFSISWGWSEADQCQIDQAGPCKTNAKNSSGFVRATNQQFAAVTARGVTFMVSSGDSGAHGRTDDSCATKKTHPDWPTSCPYITAVGATQIANGVSKGPFNTPYCTTPPSGLPACATGGSEITCSTKTGALITSGGGFSIFADAPSYQTAAIAAYIASKPLLPPAGDFNATGRGYPDVSALGHNYIIWVGGQPMQVDGTSCSAPVWGAITGLVNAARLAAGKKVVGFANPAIYQLSATAAAWTDITVGDNSCTEDGCGADCTGFGAVKGWDAATGWGTPVVSELVTAWTALP